MRDYSLVDRFMALFPGRDDAWGHVEGRCVREPVTRDLWWEHLHGEGSVGIYPIRDDNKVKWFGTDIDTGQDDLTAAANVHRALKVLGITSFVEISKGKGFHVIAFCETWIPAKTARAAMQVAHQLAKVPAKEIYPKQDALTEEKPLGNYLNMAYAKAWEPKRRVFKGTPDRYGLVCTAIQFAHLAEESRNRASVIEKAASLWTPPQPTVDVTFEQRDLSEIADLCDRLTPLGRHMLANGPLINDVTGKPDRSLFLLRLARECHAAELSPSEAVSVVAFADEGLKPPKFIRRHDGIKRIEELVEKAWQ